ncbi:MAG TPA: hypothetical protein VGH10_05585 [Actinomycetota bacterium]|jgi:hypothetical protein
MRAVRDNGSPGRSTGQQADVPLLQTARTADLPLPLVLVVWHDAWFDPEQQTPDDWRADYVVRTVGFLVRRSPRVVSIAQELLPDDDGFRAVTHIPAGMVESLTFLVDEHPPATGGAALRQGA